MIKPLVALLIGICIGHFSKSYEFKFWVAVLIMLTILQIVSFYNRKIAWGRFLFPVVFYLFWTVFGVWITVRTSPFYQTSHFSNFMSESLIVVVNDEPQIKGDNIRFVADVKAFVRANKIHRSCGKLMVTLKQDTLSRRDIFYGDLLQIQNQIQPVKPPANPEEFDYKKYLRSKEIEQQCFLLGHQVVQIGVDRGNPLVNSALSFRKQMMHKFATNIKDYNSLQLVMALIFGYRSHIDEDVVNVFRNTGTVHVLCVSGLHVGLVFGLLTLLLKWMNRFPYGRSLRSVVILIGVWFYVILTGMSPPILRAGIMITFFIVSMRINRTQIPLNTLFASALCILLFSPKSLFDIGFQLSYLAVFGILLLFPLFKSLYTPTRLWWRSIVEYTYISIAAQLFTLPLILYYFGQFPSYFIPANLFIALPSTGIMYLGILLALCPFTMLNNYIGLALAGLSHFSIQGLAYLEQLPAAVLKGFFWSDIQVLFAFFVLLTIIFAWNFKNKKAVFLSLVFCIAFSISTNIEYLKRRNYSGYRIYNVRSEVAIAQVKKGETVLYSTFDSLRHKGSIFAIIPDLRRFTDEGNIEFIHIPATYRQNYTVSLGDKKILILERELTDTLPNVDVIVWRRNNRNGLKDVVSKLSKRFVVLLDGSNSDKTIARIKQENDILGGELYILKNNFAYVWDGE